MIKEYIKNPLLYSSLKDVLYNENTNYVYCNFNINNTDNVLNTMLKTKVIDKEGIYCSFKNIDWDKIDNYYMFNTHEIYLTLYFIKDNLLDRETKVFIEVECDKSIAIVNNIIDDFFTEVDNISFYFKEQ